MVAKGIEVLKPKSCFGVRHAQTVLLFLAMVLAIGMRFNISIAIVAMTDPDNENAFDWSSQRQTVVLSSFFWGYSVLQVPAGELAARVGAKLLLLICLAVNAAVSLLTPVAAHYGGWQLVCACRVVQGLAQGFLYPSVHCLIGKWIPLEEKSSLGTFIYAGGQLGSALQYISSGFIAEYWGWPAIFYANGILSVIWTVVYMLIGSSSPATSTMISLEEKLYIHTSLGRIGEQKKLKTPWKSIFTSLPFLSLIIVHCGQNWGFWTLVPSYLKQVLGVDISSNGILSGLPSLTIYALSFPMGYMVDLILKKKWLSITTCRKISNSIAHWGPAIALFGLSYSPNDVTIAVILLCIIVGLNAGHYTGFLLVHIDMSPNFAGTLMGITNCIANFISIISPLVAGAILTDQTDPDQWKIVFFLSSGVYFACNLFFVIFGTSEKQEWNEPRDSLEKKGMDS